MNPFDLIDHLLSDHEAPHDVIELLDSEALRRTHSGLHSHGCDHTHEEPDAAASD